MNMCTPGRSFLPRPLIVLVVVLAVLVGARGRGGANRVRAVLRQEPDPLRQLQVADLHDRPLRDLLLPRDRAAPREDRRLRRERVSARQLRAEARPGLQGAAHPVLDEQRVLAAERHSRRGAGRRRRVCRTEPLPHRDADGRAVGSALPAHRPRAHAPVPVRHHPDLAHPPEHAALGVRGHVRLHDRRLAPDRSDDGARRGRRRHRAEDVRAAGLRQLRQRPR